MRRRPPLAAAPILAALAALPATGIEVAGRVIEHRSGAPAEDARVTLRYPGGQQGSASAITDENGRFRFKVGFEGRAQIEAAKPGCANSVLYLPIEANSSVVLRLVEGGAIAGRVATELGAPVPRAAIVVLRRVSGSILAPLSRNDGVPFAARTDGQGNYRLFGLAPGSYAVGVITAMDAMPHGAVGRTPAATSPLRFLSITAGEEHTNVDFILPDTDAGRINGHVEGAPAEGTVLLTLLPRDLPAVPLARALMDRGGSFHFRGIPAGAYSLFAVAPSSGSGGYAGILGPNPVFGRTELEFAADTPQEIRIQMAPSQTASFQLTGPDKTPASACSPSGTLLLTSLEGWGARMERRAEFSGSESLTIRDLAPARYLASLTGLHHGCFASGETLVDLTGGAPPVIPLQVSPGSDLRGKIVAPGPSDGGRPVVLLWPNPGDFHEAGVLAVFADASGHFAADSLRPGPYRLLAVTEEDWSKPHWQADSSAARSDRSSVHPESWTLHFFNHLARDISVEISHELLRPLPDRHA